MDAVWGLNPKQETEWSSLHFHCGKDSSTQISSVQIPELDSGDSGDSLMDCGSNKEHVFLDKAVRRTGEKKKKAEICGVCQ